VFYTTPPYYDYIWVSRRGLDSQVADSFSAAFLKLAADDPAQKKILDLLLATKYIKAEDSSYDKLRQAATDAGLLK
jgi:ABC-type phosphate/phosphonate transport system substrate-binding protein